MDVDLDEWTNSLLMKACICVVRYEDHLRSDKHLYESKKLAKAMRELKELLPSEALDIMRD